MHKKGRIELEWPIATIDNEKRHCALHKNSRIELKFATRARKEKESHVYGMHERSRMELGYPIFTVEKQSGLCNT